MPQGGENRRHADPYMIKDQRPKIKEQNHKSKIRTLLAAGDSTFLILAF
jgi:hypothetical protein